MEIFAMESADKIRAEFDEIALRVDQEQNKDFSWEEKHDSLTRELLEHLPIPCGYALDVGCGLGAVTSKLAQRVERVLAVDISPEMIRVARERFKDRTNIEFLVADLLAWKIPSEIFDCIVSKTALHHMPLDAALEKMKAGLRPGCALLILDKYEPERKQGLALVALGAVRKQMKRFGRVLQRRILKAGHTRKHMRWGHDSGETYLSMSEVYRICRDMLPGAEIRTYKSGHFYSIIWYKP
jgi:ubiquinone/menaquinone biosynthesis C-methylase UbiE